MSLPYFPMYPTDFEAKTSHLTLAEDEAYNRLLRVCWMTPGCTMPVDEAWIMRRARAHTDMEQDAVRTVLGEFFTVENGRYSNARMQREWLAANDAHERRKNAGAKGGKAKAASLNDKPSSNATAMPKQPEPEPEPYTKNRDTNVSLALIAPERSKPNQFDEFWQSFPRKIGKDKAGKAYEKAMKKVQHDDLMFALSQQLPGMAAREPQFVPHAATWLNQERWNDEIEQSHGKSGRGPSGSSGGMVAAFAAVAARKSAGPIRN